MRKEVFEPDEYYHIYDRGVDRRVIFRNDRDRIHFTHSLYILNNFLLIPRRFDIYSLAPQELLMPTDPYVEIVAGCLMPNHYHLMLTPRKKDGVSKFMHKIGTSHTKYFNIKYDRTGRLFESTFRARHVDRYEYAQYLTQYIHLNPVALSKAKLRTTKIFQEICSYRWSSLPDYLGMKSAFSPALSPRFQKEVLDLSPEEYREMTYDLFKNPSED